MHGFCNKLLENAQLSGNNCNGFSRFGWWIVGKRNQRFWFRMTLVKYSCNFTFDQFWMRLLMKTNEKLDRKFRTWLVRRLSSSKGFLHSHVQKTVCKPQWSDNCPKSHLIIHFLCWKKKSQFFSHPTYALFLFHFVGFPARSNTDWRVSPHTHEHREKESRPTFLELGKSWMISWQKN